MAMTPSERQARYRERKAAESKLDPYEMEVLRNQIAALEKAVNEVRAHVGLTQIQLPKSAYNPHR